MLHYKGMWQQNLESQRHFSVILNVFTVSVQRDLWVGKLNPLEHVQLAQFVKSR